MGEKRDVEHKRNAAECRKFDEKGLVCAIAQDWQTRRVLMVCLDER